MILIHDFLPGLMHKYTEKYCEILKSNNIPYKIANCHNSDFWDEINNSTLFIYFLGQTHMHLQQQKTLINTIDKNLKIPCLPDWNTSWHFDDKISQFYLLSSKNYPIADSWIFWDKEKALEWIEKTDFPIIFKLKRGAGSLNVSKVNNLHQAKQIVKKMFGSGIANGGIPGVKLYSVFKKDLPRYLKNKVKKTLHYAGLRYGYLENWNKESSYVLFQRFLPNNKYDTRVTVIGDKAFAFIRRNRPSDFRSSGSGLLEFDTKNINLDMIKIAFDISETFKFQTMAYDFLYDIEGKPIIVEFCCQFADWAVYTCPGYWDREFNWHAGHFWPQYTQLQSFLNQENLVQPDFEVYKGTSNLVSY